MDIRCQKCGEPWDMDSLHEEANARWPDKPWKKHGKHDQDEYERRYYNVVRREFYAKGCDALGGHCAGTKAHPGIRALYEMLGDDIDGAASLMEDHDLAYDGPED